MIRYKCGNEDKKFDYFTKKLEKNKYGCLFL